MGPFTTLQEAHFVASADGWNCWHRLHCFAGSGALSVYSWTLRTSSSLGVRPVASVHFRSFGSLLHAAPKATAPTATTPNEALFRSSSRRVITLLMGRG